MTNSIPYGTQLTLWEGFIEDSEIVFEGTYCSEGCPFNTMYRARGKECTVYVKSFSKELLSEPLKWLIIIEEDFPTFSHQKLVFYIEDDQWEAYKKIKDLTGRSPMWRLYEDHQNIPTRFGKC